MILIITNQYEPSSDHVIDWLISKKANFIRVNSEDIIQTTENNYFDIYDDHIIINGHRIKFSDVNVAWYRRWFDYKNLNIRQVDKHTRQAFVEAREEANRLTFFWFKVLAATNLKWLTNPFVNHSHNKLFALRLAREIGLDTPETIITNKKSELTAFFEKNGRKIITKPIGDPYVFIDPDNGDNYKAFTEIITPKILHKIKPEFYLSLFQNFINADYELRVFYLDGEFYATAIINSKTTDIKLSVSFGVSQINMAAVTLPADIQKKLRLLMGKLSLNAGSIDLLQTAEGKTYFLEVNPIGQFEGYAVGLNYYLDEKIADWLIKNDA